METELRLSQIAFVYILPSSHEIGIIMQKMRYKQGNNHFFQNVMKKFTTLNQLSLPKATLLATSKRYLFTQ